MKRSCVVTAIWDADARVFYSESDIKGLHVEADTLEAFEALVADLGKLMQKVSSGSEAAR